MKLMIRAHNAKLTLSLILVAVVALVWAPSVKVESFSVGTRFKPATTEHRVALATAALTSTVVLYDGALGTLPGAQQMSYQTFPFIAAATQTLSTTLTTLDTTPQQSDHAGYFRYPPPPLTLDAAIGYSVRFTTQVITETHVSADRAGFSVIALSSDPTKSIELGFWTDRVWAQSATFTHTEESLFNTTSNLTNYSLEIHGNNYVLYANNAMILTGSLRNYGPAFPTFPYTTPNLIFLGDDTSSASAKIELAKVSVSPFNYLYLPLILR